MKNRFGTVVFLALLLSGCSVAESGVNSQTGADKNVKIIGEDLRGDSLESAISELDAAGIKYVVRVPDRGGAVLASPEAEKGIWKVLTLKETGGDFIAGEISTGASVEILATAINRVPTQPTQTPTQPTTTKVTYTVTSDGPISNTTFGNSLRGNLNTEQANDVSSPFTKEYVFDRITDFSFTSFSVVAQAGEGATTISCQISIDGNVGKVQTSTGPYAVVSCSK
jgi:hypothetical protein